MFNNKLIKRIKELETQVELLKEAKIGEIFYGKYPIQFGWGGFKSRESIKVDEAVKLIIQHLGIEITKTPEKPAVIGIKRIKKEKKK